jgi:hypothetical protein
MRRYVVPVHGELVWSLFDSAYVVSNVVFNVVFLLPICSLGLVTTIFAISAPMILTHFARFVPAIACCAQPESLEMDELDCIDAMMEQQGGMQM